MIRAEQVPEDVWVQVALRLESCGAVISDAVAKIVAAEVINAWPGMAYDPGALVTDAYRDPGKIILPLTESNNDKG